METNRLILLFVFSLSAFFLWEAWQKENSLVQRTGIGTTVPTAKSPDTVFSKEAVDVPSVDGQRVTITTDYYDLVINSLGGTIEEMRLKKHRDAIDVNSPYVLLEKNEHRQYYAQAGLLGDGLPTHKTLYQIEPGPLDLGERAELKLKLFTVTQDGIRVERIYTFTKGSYLIGLSTQVVNNGTKAIVPSAYYQLVRDNQEPQGTTKMVSAFNGIAAFNAVDKFRKISFADIDKGKGHFEQKQNNGWIGFVQQYFMTAWLPLDNQPTAEREFYTKKVDDTLYAAGLILPLLPAGQAVAPGEKAQQDIKLYVGPQEQDVIGSYAKQGFGTGMEYAVDYGIFMVVAKPLFTLLQWLHKLVNNWGWSIILLTGLIRGVFYPLNAASARSMAKMKLVAPKLKAVQEMYAQDRQRLHQAMMELYKTEKINPFGGCLPILVQIPIFLALYWVLLGAVELRYAPWVGYLKDLSAPDPYFILPVLYAITAYLQVKLQPVSPGVDPTQQKMMQIMPVAFSVLFLFFPSGLVLYWLVSNMLAILQQWHVNRVLEREAALVAAKKR